LDGLPADALTRASELGTGEVKLPVPGSLAIALLDGILSFSSSEFLGRCSKTGATYNNFGPCRL
jgi:hypothetical protein